MTTIHDLVDCSLAQIFKNLPPYDRLRVSQVCKRWFFVSQGPWREVTHIELTSISSESIGAIVRKCPNLASLCCKDQELILADLKNIVLASLKSLKLHGCTFVSHNDSGNETALPLFTSEQGQPLEEVILHQIKLDVEDGLSEQYLQRLLPVSLRRLQLSGLSADESYLEAEDNYIRQLDKLQDLECLILHVAIDSDFRTKEYLSSGFRLISTLTNLRELFLPTLNRFRQQWWALEVVAKNLSRLEILILPTNIRAPDPSLDLFAKHPALRVLVIPGRLHVSEGLVHVGVHVRNRFVHGFADNPLPFLHIFVGSEASALFCFEDSPTNGLKVHPINAPFSEILDREEIPEIFDGSWIARKIKEGAKRGIKFWTYEESLVDSVCRGCIFRQPVIKSQD